MPHRATYFFPRKFDGVVVRDSSLKSEDHEKVSEEISGLMIKGDVDPIEGVLSYGIRHRSHGKKNKNQVDALKRRFWEERRAGGSERDYVGFSKLNIDHDTNTQYDVAEENENDFLQVNGHVTDKALHVSDRQVSEEESKTVRDQEFVDGGREDDGRWSMVRRWCKTYYLQVTLAKRIARHAITGEEPTSVCGGGQGVVAYDAESVSYRLWVHGTLSYNDKVSDGFYNILGMDPYMWMMCNDLEEGKHLPTLLELKAVDANTATMEVSLVDRYKDSRLRDLEDIAQELYFSAENSLMLAKKLAELVASTMGGSFPIEQGDLHVRWESSSKKIKELQNNILVPIGSLSIGLCRHRAILFKKLADYVGLPCRIAKGCKYCVEDHRSSCLIKIEDDKLIREYTIDLIGQPGNIHNPDSSINGDVLSLVPSPFQNSYLKDIQQVYVCQASVPDVKSTHAHTENTLYSDFSAVGLSGDPYFKIATKKPPMVKFQGQSNQEVESDGRTRGNFAETSTRYLTLEPSLAMDWLEMAWDDLHIKERIGAGSFGTVYRAEWHGSDVAVKVLTSQELHDDQLRIFLREVSIMKRVRHPNVVLFMGAITVHPRFSIVTEYLPRGSLFRLLHHPASGEILNMKRRLRMALDVAKGINYLHCLSPPIVHSDLKSLNLVVDKMWTVKVCDFGLSRFKADTFISSKAITGTPEWMAPEVLRGETADEKSDVYSFGVILWELVTMQQPWNGLGAAQVVGAVGFQNRKLTIPDNTSPVLSSLMETCWADDAAQRPSFKSILSTLKKFLKTPQDNGRPVTDLIQLLITLRITSLSIKKESLFYYMKYLILKSKCMLKIFISKRMNLLSVDFMKYQNL